jgi:acetyl-CoA C-acetyltransferase
LRTPVGRYGGALRDVPVAELAATVIRGLIDQTGIQAEAVDEVILGQCYPNGEAPALGRVAALDAGLPVSVTGLQLDRRCGSGLQAVLQAVLQVEAGISGLVIAGGAESMSQAEYYADIRWGPRADRVEMNDRLARGRATAGGRNYPVPGGMIETAENLRRTYGISRVSQDELAVKSHERAIDAQRQGRFKEEIVSVAVPYKHGTEIVDTDEHPRPDSNVDSLARLTPIMRASDPDATVTAGNSSGQNDGAAACIVTGSATAEKLGLRPIARVVSWATAGVAPNVMGIGPVPATTLALERAGLAFKDVELVELNEAFAAQALAVLAEWGMSPADDRLNVNGSGISLGHPVGATGGRILATLLHEMQRRGARYGLETMCIGGGQGLTAIFEAI